jgi:hypothetical protein
LEIEKNNSDNIERRRIGLDNFENYWASRDGRIWKHTWNGFREIKALKGGNQKRKVALVQIYNKKWKKVRICRAFLVLTAWKGYAGRWFKVVHKGDYRDDSVCNLRWRLRVMRTKKHGVKSLPNFFDILEDNDEALRMWLMGMDSIMDVGLGKLWCGDCLRRYEDAVNSGRKVDWGKIFKI